MASLIFAAGAFTYDKVQKSREKKRAAREDRSLRYSELEKDHAEHLARTQSGREICHCEREGWDEKTHRVGCVRARGTMELDEEGDWIDVGGEGHFAGVDQGRAEKRRSEAPPSYESLEVERKGKGGISGGMRGRRIEWLGDTSWKRWDMAFGASALMMGCTMGCDVGVNMVYGISVYDAWIIYRFIGLMSSNEEHRKGRGISS